MSLLWLAFLAAGPLSAAYGGDELCRQNGALGDDAAICASSPGLFSSRGDPCDSYISNTTVSCVNSAIKAFLDFMKGADRSEEDAALGRFDAALGEFDKMFKLGENPATKNNAQKKRLVKIKAKVMPMLEKKRNEMLAIIEGRASGRPVIKSAGGSMDIEEIEKIGKEAGPAPEASTAAPGGTLAVADKLFQEAPAEEIKEEPVPVKPLRKAPVVAPTVKEKPLPPQTLPPVFAPAQRPAPPAPWGNGLFFGALLFILLAIGLLLTKTRK